MQAYSMDLRVRVLADCDAQLGTKAVASKHRVSESWVRRLKQRRREQGAIAPRPSGGRRRVVIDRQRLADLVELSIPLNCYQSRVEFVPVFSAGHKPEGLCRRVPGGAGRYCRCVSSPR